jgi:hypothetical protein
MAGVDTGSAEGAFPLAELDARIAGVFDEDLRRTGSRAIAAARAGRKKSLLGQRPGRAQRQVAREKASAQELAA